MEKILTWAGATFIALIVAVLLGLFGGLPVMLLWNSLIPALFGLQAISFWQALQLSLLCAILFK